MTHNLRHHKTSEAQSWAAAALPSSGRAAEPRNAGVQVQVGPWLQTWPGRLHVFPLRESQSVSLSSAQVLPPAQDTFLTALLCSGPGPLFAFLAQPLCHWYHGVSHVFNPCHRLYLSETNP